MEQNLEYAIESVIDDLKSDIQTCAIHTGYQPKENCTGTCDMYKICQKIWKTEKELNEE